MYGFISINCVETSLFLFYAFMYAECSQMLSRKLVNDRLVYLFCDRSVYTKITFNYLVSSTAQLARCYKLYSKNNLCSLDKLYNENCILWPYGSYPRLMSL